MCRIDDDTLADWAAGGFKEFTDGDVAELATEVIRLRLLSSAAAEITDADREARMRMLTGWFHPFAPRPGEIRIRDIARGLAGQIRYKNQTRTPYTVAEHSVIVSLLVHPDHAREALLHDATEAYLGDMSSPVKRAPIMRPFREVEDRLQAEIYAAFGVVPTEASSLNVHVVDQRVCSDEMAALMVPWEGMVPGEHEEAMRRVVARCGQPFDVSIPFLPMAVAEELFAARFADLFPERLAD